MQHEKHHIVALIEWSHLIEDYLDNIGLSFDDFIGKMTGGWLFGYIEALKQSGANTVLFCFSARVTSILRVKHEPTGSLICILPAGCFYRLMRRRILNPYAASVEEAVGAVKGVQRWTFSFLLKAVPYLATPVRVLIKEIKRQQCNVILCQDYEHARFDLCALIARILNLPVFATFQGGNWQMYRYERWIRPFSLRACTGLIVASKDELKRICQTYQIPVSKVAQIFNPIDMRMWQGISQVEARRLLQINLHIRLVVWHGRIDYYRKGLDVLLNAWEGICAEHPHHTFQLLLIGTGTNANILTQRLKSNGLKNVTWVNEYINDRKLIQTYLKAGNIYAFPSRNEGFPVAPVEAMACGLALIAADAPGVPEILQSRGEEVGVLVPRNNVPAFKKALLQLLLNEELCDQLGRQASEHVQRHFSLKAVGDKLAEFLFHNAK